MTHENAPEPTKGDKEGVLLAATSDTTLLFTAVSINVEEDTCKLVFTVGGNVLSTSITKGAARVLLAQLQERLD